MNIAPNEVVHRGCHIDRTARSAEYCSAMLVNVINKCMGNSHRFRPARGIKTLITAPEPQHLGHSVGMMEFKEQRADHVVQGAARTGCVAPWSADRRWRRTPSGHPSG